MFLSANIVLSMNYDPAKTFYDLTLNLSINLSSSEVPGVSCSLGSEISPSNQLKTHL